MTHITFNRIIFESTRFCMKVVEIWFPRFEIQWRIDPVSIQSSNLKSSVDVARHYFLRLWKGFLMQQWISYAANRRAISKAVSQTFLSSAIDSILISSNNHIPAPSEIPPINFYNPNPGTQLQLRLSRTSSKHLQNI